MRVNDDFNHWVMTPLMTTHIHQVCFNDYPHIWIGMTPWVTTQTDNNLISFQLAFTINFDDRWEFKVATIILRNGVTRKGILAVIRRGGCNGQVEIADFGDNYAGLTSIVLHVYWWQLLQYRGNLLWMFFSLSSRMKRIMVCATYVVTCTQILTWCWVAV